MTTNRAALWLLNNRLNDVRDLTLDGFQIWLRQRLTGWSHDPVFAQRAKIRDLRRSHPDLLTAEKVWRRAQSRDQASAVYRRLSDLEDKLNGASKAVAGLAAAGRADKLAVFQDRQRELQASLSELSASSPERQTMLAARGNLDRLRQQTGLEEQTQVLKRLLRQSGRGSGDRGRAFERVCLKHCQSHLMPLLGADLALTGVTLGAVDTEFDVLLIKANKKRAVVLAAVEAKRSVNDLAHGFRLRQRNLAWLAGGGELQTTALYRSGQFDRPYHQDGLAFDRESFQSVQLHLVSRPGWVLGMNSGALGRLGYRISTDVGFCWDGAYMQRLREWALQQTDVVETPDLLRMSDLKLTLLEV